jgi:dihydrodipicolinate synthase/N-acetylneuraminate lyase
MESPKKFSGIICPILTPFDSSGQVDVRGLNRLVEFLIEHGIRTLMPCGSTGEGPLLTLAERKLVAESVMKQGNGRIEVLVHTGCITTAETLELTRHAQSIGADGASIITPYYFTYDDDALCEHYTTVANAVPEFPIALYCYPANAKHKISAGLLSRMRAQASNIIAIKLTDPDLIRFQEYVQAGGADFCTLGGVDAVTLPTLSVGSMGQVSGNSNVIPDVFVKLYQAFMAGDIQEAQRQQIMVNRVRAVLKDEISYFKAALNLRGIPVGDARPPLRKLNPAEFAEMKAGLEELGLL